MSVYGTLTQYLCPTIKFRTIKRKIKKNMSNSYKVDYSINKTVRNFAVRMKYIFTLVSLLLCIEAYGKPEVVVDSNKVNVISQMNFCISTLTNIISNKSMSVLEHESNQLVNNLTMEQIVGLPDIKDFRIDLLDAISKFEITEEERDLMRRLNSMKRENLKWNALANALNPTMLVTGGGNTQLQIAFQTLVSVARTAVEYKSMKGEQAQEELQAMWELRKEDLKTINDIRKTALNITFNLYEKYLLSEEDRLTEATATAFCDYIKESNAAKRLRILEDNRRTYQNMPEFYYYLGMAYADMKQYSKAKQNFLIYLDMYSKAPILRYDERSGCIALTMLAFEKTLPGQEKEKLIDIALKNLPHNSAAILQCALVYTYELRKSYFGLNLLRIGIDDPLASDRDLLFMAAAKILPLYNQFPSIRKYIYSAYNQANNIDLESYLMFLINSRSNALPKLTSCFSFDKLARKLWYCLWFCSEFNYNFHILLPKRLSWNPDNISIYIEEHDDEGLTITQMNAEYANAITEKDIDKVDCFKSNKSLKYLFVETLYGNLYRLKKNIDLEKIKNEEWPRMSEFSLSEDDIDDIVDFCEDFSADSQNEIICKNIKADFVDKDSVNGVPVRFKGLKLSYKPHHSTKQEGYYVRIIFKTGIELIYKYDSDEKKLQPYAYSYNGKMQYSNKENKEEYEHKEVGFWQRIRNFFANLF